MRMGLRILIVVVLSAFSAEAGAAEGDKFSKQQLDQLLAPIALYPDDLLTNVLIAVPAEYGNAGVKTFIVNQDGVVYEKDLGEETADAAAAIARFDPDPSWAKVDGNP